MILRIPAEMLPQGMDKPFELLYNVHMTTTPTQSNRGLLPVGTILPQGTVAQTSFTAYQLTDGSWVSFDQVHGRPGAAAPLVVLG